MCYNIDIINLEEKISMKLVARVNNNVRGLASKWGVYELSEEQEKKYGKKYALCQGIFSEDAFELYSEDELIEGLKEHLYEGLFDTVKEALLTVETVRLKNLIYDMKRSIEGMIKSCNEAENVELEVTQAG